MAEHSPRVATRIWHGRLRELSPIASLIPRFNFALKLDRREATKLLAAHVDNITFTSVISDEGVMLTQVRLEMQPGDKRLLNFITLPKDARFWFAFVNQNGVWPWRDQDKMLIPLEQQAADGKALPVEIFTHVENRCDGRRLPGYGIACAEIRSTVGECDVARFPE